MAGWDSYTQKSTPADADTLMIKDTSGGANKRTPFSGVWNWIVSKLASAVISQLETTKKSIIPAINELNSKSLTKSYWLSSTGWKRVLKFEATSISAAQGSMGYGCLIIVRSVYQNSENMYSLISFASQYYNSAKSNFLKLHHIGNGPITKIRHTVDTKTNTAYIEIYNESNNGNDVSISVPSNIYGRDIVAWKDAGGAATEETVSGVTVISTLSLP